MVLRYVGPNYTFEQQRVEINNLATDVVGLGTPAYSVTAGYATSSGIATYATNAGTSTSVIGGIGSITSLNVSGVATFQNSVYLGDNDFIYFGDSSDLYIGHNGSVSAIADAGTGDLYIAGDNSLIITDLSYAENKAKFNTNGSVELYYDNSKKFETLGAGVTVTGTTFTDQLSVSSSTTLGTVQVSSGIVTATSGVVTYYGDGSQLTGISAVGSGSQWVTTSAGIHTLSNVGIGTTNPTSNIHIGSGTTTISPLQINSGSLLTIPQVGAIEYDGTTFYATPNQTSGRGILSSQSYYRIGNTAITGNTGTSAQNALGVLANVNSSTVYQFEYLLAFSKPTGTNTHNFVFRFLNGTATVNNIFLHRVLFAPLFDGTTYTGATTSYLTTFTYNNVVQAPLTIFAIVRGTVGIATGGTIGPQYTLSANPGGAYSTISGSYFSIWPIGIGTSNISVGQWT